MNKNDLIFIVKHTINSTPLKQFIKATFDAKYKGTSENDHLDFLDKLSIDEIESIIMEFYEQIPLNYNIYCLSDHEVTFTSADINGKLLDASIQTAILNHPLVHRPNIISTSNKVFYYQKASIQYFSSNETGTTLSQVQNGSIYIPAQIEFYSDNVVKFSVGKLKLNKEVQNIPGLGFVILTKIKFKPEQDQAVLTNAFVKKITGSNVMTLDLTNGIIKLIHDKKISACDFGWIEPSGTRKGKKEWTTNDQLNPYDYIHGLISTAQAVLPAKWYFTDSRKNAELQDIKILPSLSVNPSKGLIRTNKFNDYSVTLIDELINESDV